MSTMPSKAMRQTTFGELGLGAFFKENPSGAWHLKSTGGRGLFKSRGVDGAPTFSSDEVVWVESAADTQQEQG